MSTLPFRTDFDHLRRQAKDLLRRAQAEDPEAVAKMAAVSPAVNLASAQLAIARYYGFASWPQLKKEAERKEAEKAEAGWTTLARFGSWFDDEAQTDRSTEYHRGSCRNCGTHYAFETSVVFGFADHVEAHCPTCGSSLGTFREDVGISIDVRVVAEEG